MARKGIFGYKIKLTEWNIIMSKYSVVIPEAWTKPHLLSKLRYAEIVPE